MSVRCAGFNWQAGKISLDLYQSCLTEYLMPRVAVDDGIIRHLRLVRHLYATGCQKASKLSKQKVRPTV